MDHVRAKLYADEIHRAGITGRGITVAVLDSGVCRHPDYADRIVGFVDMINGRKDCYDDASHGSHVSGIVGGDGRSSMGRYRGIAPGCNLLHVKVLDSRGQGSLLDIFRGIDWVIANRQRFHIRVMNISAGTTRGEDDEGSRMLVERVEEAWDSGLIVVAAAGNMGPGPMSITAPGNSRKIITVGSSNQFRRRQANVNANYSGCGPTQECVCKPELVVPGTNIVSCSPMWQQGQYYARKSGTSMAAPAVSGCIALLLEREPYLTNVQVKMRLRESAVSLGLPKNRQGWGMPDLRRLLLL